MLPSFPLLYPVSHHGPSRPSHSHDIGPYPPCSEYRSAGASACPGIVYAEMLRPSNSATRHSKVDLKSLFPISEEQGRVECMRPKRGHWSRIGRFIVRDKESGLSHVL
jgi:hypothetical protein